MARHLVRAQRVCELPRGLQVVITATDLVAGRALRMSQEFTGGWDYGYGPTPPRLTVATALAASTAVPFLFPPVPLRTEALGLGDHAPSELWLVDGGVYDNLGLEWFQGWDRGRPAAARPVDFILSIDASGQLQPKPRRYGWLSSLKRSQEAQYAQTRAGRLRWFVDQMLSGKLRGVYVPIDRDPASHPQLPGELAAAFLRGYDDQESTQEAYARDLADWFVWLARARVNAFDATLASIENYSREPLPTGRPPAPATLARRLACLSHFYRRAHNEGLIERNPVEFAARPKVAEQAETAGLSKQRARRLIAAARAEGPRETLLVLLLLELGLRISEAVGADIEDLGEQGRHRVLRIKSKGQSTKSAVAPLNASLAHAVEQARAGRTHGPLLITSTGRRLTRQQAGKLIKRLGEQVGLPHLHPHALRHGFVTLSLDEGASLRDVQDAARHADPRTTRRYDRNRNSLNRHPTHRLLGALEP
jgi:integrase/recombinase XerD